MSYKSSFLWQKLPWNSYLGVIQSLKWRNYRVHEIKLFFFFLSCSFTLYYFWSQNIPMSSQCYEMKWHEVRVTQLCPTLCNPMDYIFHGILQARILEWVAFPFPRGSSQHRDWTQGSCIVEFFISWATREAQIWL